MRDYVSEARQKYIKHVTNDMFDIPIEISQFYGYCYLNMTPAQYGKIIQERIRQELNLCKSKGIGDATMYNPISNNFFKLFFEIKTSFRNKNGNYSIRHLRQWEENDYFILVLVDVYDYCRAFYCVIEYENIVKNFTLTKVNKTSSSVEIYDDDTSMGFSISPKGLRKLRDNSLVFVDNLEDFIFSFSHIKNSYDYIINEQNMNN